MNVFTSNRCHSLGQPYCRSYRARILLLTKYTLRSLCSINNVSIADGFTKQRPVDVDKRTVIYVLMNSRIQPEHRIRVRVHAVCKHWNLYAQGTYSRHKNDWENSIAFEERVDRVFDDCRNDFQ